MELKDTPLSQKRRPGGGGHPKWEFKKEKSPLRGLYDIVINPQRVPLRDPIRDLEYYTMVKGKFNEYSHKEG